MFWLNLDSTNFNIFMQFSDILLIAKGILENKGKFEIFLIEISSFIILLANKTSGNILYSHSSVSKYWLKFFTHLQGIVAENVRIVEIFEFSIICVRFSIKKVSSKLIF